MRSKRALVVGRTIDDLAECKKFNFPNHPPAPTTCLFSDYANFDGDVITAQSIKYGAVAAGSIELSKRVFWSAENNPDKVYVGTSGYHRIYHCPEEYRDKINFLFTDEHDYPTANSGLFCLWLAVHLGYTEIYTVGLDLISIGFNHGHTYDHAIASRYVHDFELGRDLSSYSIETHKKDQMSFNIADKIINDNPDVKFYKTGNFSHLPVPIKIPPTKK